MSAGDTWIRPEPCYSNRFNDSIKNIERAIIWLLHLLLIHHIRHRQAVLNTKKHNNYRSFCRLRESYSHCPLVIMVFSRQNITTYSIIKLKIAPPPKKSDNRLIISIGKIFIEVKCWMDWKKNCLEDIYVHEIYLNCSFYM